MKFSFDTLSVKDRYKLLTSLVVPRPIAWVSTCSIDGQINVAPFSFFNIMGHDPAIVALGIMAHPDKPLKDTARNIEATGEFVVNLVDEALAPAMNATAADLPFGVCEIDLERMRTAPSSHVNVPRICASPAALECRQFHSVPMPGKQRIILGEVLAVQVADALVIDHQRCHIDLNRHAPIARMGGAGIYCRSTDRFELDRPDRATQPLETS